MHDDCTLIFAQIATLQLCFSDSSTLATAPGTHIDIHTIQIMEATPFMAYFSAW